MAKIYDGIKELVGNTPLVRLRTIEERYQVEAAILAKEKDR